MGKIFNIKYVDAHYTYAEKFDTTELPVQEAYGYVERKENNIIIIFIKKRGSDNTKTIEEKENIIKGLIIPDAALLSMVDKYETDILKNAKIGTHTTVTWRDVLYFANVPVYECSIMRTEGILFKIEKDLIVLKDPKTVRMYPTPVKNNPEDGNPTLYKIPISFITVIE